MEALGSREGVALFREQMSAAKLVNEELRTFAQSIFKMKEAATSDSRADSRPESGHRWCDACSGLVGHPFRRESFRWVCFPRAGAGAYVCLASGLYTIQTTCTEHKLTELSKLSKHGFEV